MSRREKHKKSAFISKTIAVVIFGGILFWSAFWPSAYFFLSKSNDRLIEEVKQNEYLPRSEKVKMIGENF